MTDDRLPDPISGVKVGSWTNRDALTGCTVVLFDRALRTTVDVRGGAPGTRETDLLHPGRLVQRADAILLTGGSAFGLDAASGVTAFLANQGRGYPTPAGPVPIVPAAVLYDLSTGLPETPGAAEGKAACENARPVTGMERGQVGAGTGATTQKLWEAGRIRRGGLGFARVDVAGGSISAVVAVNSAGAIVDSRTGLSAYDGEIPTRMEALSRPGQIAGREATTLAVLLVDLPCTQDGLLRIAVAAHDGMARAIIPCHTLIDGDVVFVTALGEDLGDDRLTLPASIAAELAMEQAILDAVTA